ncbi:hypothetical protein pdam_00024525, partial [Pocillopora damicornis]
MIHVPSARFRRDDVTPDQIGVNTRYYVTTTGVLLGMKVLEERIAMDLVVLNIISILALTFFPTKTKGQAKTIDALGKGIERNAHTGVAFARFKAHKLSYLNITALGADYVHSSRDCGLTCINTPSCFSFNLAAVVDMNSKILCELLPSDIYNNSDKLVANRLFHHFSIWRNAHTGVAFARFKAHKLSHLNITALRADYVHSSKDCGLACINTPSCFSFNLAAVVDMNSKILCELLPSDIHNNSDKLVANHLFHHFSIWSPCLNRPCQNKGTCRSNNESNSYVCVCTEGYTGSNCEA